MAHDPAGRLAVRLTLATTRRQLIAGQLDQAAAQLAELDAEEPRAVERATARVALLTAELAELDGRIAELRAAGAELVVDVEEPERGYEPRPRRDLD